jgi:hypothetical protein
LPEIFIGLVQPDGFSYDRTAMATPAATITLPAARLSRRTERLLVNILRARLAK